MTEPESRPPHQPAAALSNDRSTTPQPDNARNAGTAGMQDPELDTLASLLRLPVEPDPYSSESACRQAIDVIAAIGRDPSRAEVPSVAASGDQPALGEFGQYRLLAKLGEGGMGTVYKALHTRLEKVVALKMLPADRMKDESALARFNREMKAVGRLNHPNIVAAHDAGEIEGTHYLVMELVEGIDLSTLAGRLGQLDVPEACEIIRQAALGLDHAHQHDMVHRDIKPSNLMLTGHGEVKVLDLGLALLQEQSALSGSELTSTGQMMGTFEYMAPEQGSDSHTVDHRADIYSLGATLYKLLCGHAPFAGEKYNTPMKRMMALATEEPVPIRDLRPDVPAKLARLIHRMLARNPSARPSTASEVAAAMEPFTGAAALPALLDRAKATAAPQSAEPGTMATEPAASSAMDDTSPTATPSRFVPEQREGTVQITVRKPKRSVRARPSWAAAVQASVARIPPRIRRGAVIAAAAAAAMIFLAVLIIIRNQQGKEVARVEVPDGGTAEVRDTGATEPTGTHGPVVADRSTALKSPPPTVVKLTDLKPLTARAEHYAYSVNDLYPKNAWPSMRPDVELATEYLYASAPSRIRYRVPEGMKSFTAVGYCPCRWSVKFKVMAGDKTLFESKPECWWPIFGAIRVDLPPGTEEIDLIAQQAYTQESALQDARRFCWLAPRLHPVPADEVGNLFCKRGDHVSLTTAEPLLVRLLGSKVLINRVPKSMAPPVAYDGFGRCEEFVYACAPSRAEYEIPSGAKAFSAIGYCGSGSVRFDVYADNTRIYSSPNAGVVPIEVRIPDGASILTLVALGNNHRDYSTWCYPRFHWPFSDQGSIEERMAWISAALKRLNPQFNGKVKFEVEEGKIVEVDFTLPDWNVAIADISPLRHLEHLRRLDLQKAPVEYFKPLTGLPLEYLNVHDSPQVPDLSPLVESPLEALHGPITSLRDCRTLRQIKTLKTINDRPVVEALREAEEMIARKASEAEAAKLQDTKLTDTPETRKPATLDELPPPEIVRLIDLEPVIAIVGRYAYSVNQGGSPSIRPDVELATEYLYVHAPSRIRYPVPEGMKSFSVVAYRPRWWSVKFKVMVGNKTLFDDKPGTFTIIRVDLPPGTDEIGLVVERAADPGHACWLVPRLHPVPAEEIKDLFGESGEHVSLTTVEPSLVSVGASELMVNRVPKGMAPPVLYKGFTPCKEFTYAFAPSRAEYEIPAGAKSFSAIGYCTNGSVRFEVYADNTRVYSSPSAGIVPIEVQIPDGASTLALVVLGNNHRDHSKWCYPRFHWPFPDQGSIEERKAWIVAELKRLNPEFKKDSCKMTDKDGRISYVYLSHQHNRLKDISPLAELRFEHLQMNRSEAVEDLTPLAGMPLRKLEVHGTHSTNLSPLQGAPLVDLQIDDSRVTNLAPIKGAPLQILTCHNTKISDLSPLAGAKLTKLSIYNTLVSDLTPLAGMPLRELRCEGTLVKDFLPLKDTPLLSITCDFVPEQDAEALRQIKTLKTINGKPAAEVLGKPKEKPVPKQPAGEGEVVEGDATNAKAGTAKAQDHPDVQVDQRSGD